MQSTLIIERSFYAVSPEGAGAAIRVGVAAPVPRESFDWACATWIDFLDPEERTVFGIDSWQAASLAMTLIATRIGHFEQRGWTFFWASDRSQPFHAAALAR
ncbi:DUF6968 family protein [Undibacterium sp.]|uniref:DUF6968 family protein n=1 Tax=Undibacterium sp. TaxID=1914977 RepID=UPI00374D9721